MICFDGNDAGLLFGESAIARKCCDGDECVLLVTISVTLQILLQGIQHSPHLVIAKNKQSAMKRI